MMEKYWEIRMQTVHPNIDKLSKIEYNDKHVWHKSRASHANSVARLG